MGDRRADHHCEGAVLHGRECVNGRVDPPLDDDRDPGGISATNRVGFFSTFVFFPSDI